MSVDKASLKLYKIDACHNADLLVEMRTVIISQGYSAVVAVARSQAVSKVDA